MTTIDLTDEEIRVIVAGLEELKFKVAAPIVAKIKTKYLEQINKNKETNGTLSNTSRPEEEYNKS